MAHAHPNALLDGTLQTLDQSRSNTSAPNAPAGADLIKSWISVLKHTAQAEAATIALQNLYDELINPQPNPNVVREQLRVVAAQTRLLSAQAEAQYARQLEQLAGALDGFSTDLGQPGQREDTVGNPSAPGQVGTLFEQSINTLGSAAPSLEQGRDLIRQWATVLGNRAELIWLTEPLHKLNDALENSDWVLAQRLTRDLAGQLADLADNGGGGDATSSLHALGTALKAFAQDVLRS